MAVQSTASAIRPKPYLSIRDLSALTPWTEQAIRTMMAKGILREGERFFTSAAGPSSSGRLSWASSSIVKNTSNPEYHYGAKVS